MKKIIGTVVTSSLLAFGASHATAQETISQWVQNANFSLTAQVQTGENTVQAFALNTKAIIQYLKGTSLTNAIEDITTVTNGTATVTNNVFLPTNPFPDIFVISNYSITVGTNHFTNGVQFTNPVVLVLTETNPVTYLLTNNLVVLGTNVTGLSNDFNFFLITNVPPSPEIIAIQETNSAPSNTVFTLIGITNIVTTTNGVTVEVPSNFLTKNPKLIVKSFPDEQTFTWFIRDGTTDYDVTPFFTYNILNEVSQAKGTGFNDWLDLSVDFDNGAGTLFGTEANAKQSRGLLKGQQALVVKSVNATCAGAGNAAPPPTGQPLTGKPFPSGLMVIGGKFNVSGGKLETTTVNTQ